MDKKILITGASGFVGTHLIEHLNALGYEIDAVSNKTQSILLVERVFTWGNLTTIGGPYNYVIHLAGLAHDTTGKNEEKAYYEVNVGLTAQLLLQLDKWKTEKFISLSSIKAMVDSFSDELIDEDSKFTPTQVYGLSKLKAEKSILNDPSKAKKFIFRPVLIYGPGQKGNLQLLEKLIAWYCPIPLKQWKNQRSILYIKNLNFIVHQTLEHEVDAGVYLVADDQLISTFDIIKSIAKGKKKTVLGFGLPSAFFNFLLRFSPYKIKLILNKVLGSLAVDNRKIKSALQISAMPYSTEAGIHATYNRKKN
jgi:nucleoside-diphosphate-sugar epimerase